MRRKEREVTDKTAILEILKTNKVCRLGMVDGEQPYVLPMNYGFDFENGSLKFYLHGAKVGKKIDVLNKNNNVCVELDCKHELKEATMPCNYSYKYASIIAMGKAKFLNEPEKKSYALNKLMENQMGKNDFEFDNKVLDAVEVIEIDILSYSCKENS